jgi:hypothetical protein
MFNANLLENNGGCMFKKYDNNSEEVTNNPLRFEYKNWKGEVSLRKAIPIEIWYGYTDYHTSEQWMMKAWDVDKQAKRDFAMRDIIRFISD